MKLIARISKAVFVLLSMGVAAWILIFLVLHSSLGALLVDEEMWIRGALFPFLSIVGFGPASASFQKPYFHDATSLTVLQWLAMSALNAAIVGMGWIKRIRVASLLVCGLTALIAVLCILMSDARLAHFRT